MRSYRSNAGIRESFILRLRATTDSSKGSISADKRTVRTYLVLIDLIVRNIATQDPPVRLPLTY